MPEHNPSAWTVRPSPPGTELASATERLLARLPGWFGIAAANTHYVESSRRLPGYLALNGNGDAVGLLTITRHFPGAAEVYLMAVDPSWHRRGVGTSLLVAAEGDLAADGCRLLEVKTLGASHPSPEYAATREFYLARGFEPVEEIPNLWPGNPCLLMLKPLGGGGASAAGEAAQPQGLDRRST